jgi:hypothetical protein
MLGGTDGVEAVEEHAAELLATAQREKARIRRSAVA